jgi:hypothetical protein
MKILHLLRGEPDETTQLFINEASKDKEHAEVPLYQGDTDYDVLIEDIFEADQVITWW